MSGVEEEEWAPVARASRQALELLGYPIGPRCLPDEPDACDGSSAQHALAHFAVLRAIADHQAADHLSDPGIYQDIYLNALHELRTAPGCQLHGGSPR